MVRRLGVVIPLLPTTECRSLSYFALAKQWTIWTKNRLIDRDIIVAVFLSRP